MQRASETEATPAPASPRALPDPNHPLGTKRAFLPYPPFVLEPTLPVRLTGVVVNGADVTAEAADHPRCRIRPHVVANWREVVCTVQVADVLDQVAEAADFPVRDAGRIELVGRFWCHATRFRGAIRFTREPDGPLPFKSTLRLRRDDVEGLVEIDVFAVRTDTPEGARRGVADQAMSRLAVSPRWVLEVDPVEAPAAGAFDFEYVDFTNPKPAGRYRGEDARLLRLIPYALSHVVIRPEGPLVLVNANSQELVELTLAKGTVGARARLRDAALKHIATAAWRAILDEALACSMRTGEDGVRSAAPLGDEHWSTRVLERAAKESHRGGTLDDLLEDLCSDELRPGLLAFLAERLGSISRDPWQKLLEELTA